MEIVLYICCAHILNIKTIKINLDLVCLRLDFVKILIIQKNPNFVLSGIRITSINKIFIVSISVLVRTIYLSLCLSLMSLSKSSVRNDFRCLRGKYGVWAYGFRNIIHIECVTFLVTIRWQEQDNKSHLFIWCLLGI